MSTEDAVRIRCSCGNNIVVWTDRDVKNFMCRLCHMQFTVAKPLYAFESGHMVEYSPGVPAHTVGNPDGG